MKKTTKTNLRAEQTILPKTKKKWQMKLNVRDLFYKKKSRTICVTKSHEWNTFQVNSISLVIEFISIESCFFFLLTMFVHSNTVIFFLLNNSIVSSHYSSTLVIKWKFNGFFLIQKMNHSFLIELLKHTQINASIIFWTHLRFRHSMKRKKERRKKQQKFKSILTLFSCVFFSRFSEIVFVIWKI